MNQIIVVSGPPGAGKSSVGAALCERFDRMLLVEVDDLRHMVRAGYRHPWVGDQQAREQLALGAGNAAAIALVSVAARYSVVIADVVTAEAVTWYRDALAGTPVAVELVTLLPSLEVTRSGNADRDGAMEERAAALRAQLSTEIAAGSIPGAVLDTSAHANARESADAVQDAISRGQALFLTPSE
ncbi:MAG: AAA family ATPase [Chloroflexi bacterium]|nr:AAA family ATPase [Chloroflexota bacterium]MDA1147525.1 AAA family ATPase [Chloroflexota bacterium]